MSGRNIRKIKALLNLLDDEDEAVAVEAMAELLGSDVDSGELDRKLALFQEDSNPLIRKRIHQLQAALAMRRRRRDFSRRLDDGSMDMAGGLQEVHLQWFDNDSQVKLQEMWDSFAASAASYHIDSLEKLAGFMRKNGMTALEESTFQPENYCIGAILDSGCGASSVLTCIAWILASESHIDARPVRVLAEFGLLDGCGNLLLPGHNWQIAALKDTVECTFLTKEELLRFASAMLFSHAVNSDSFRYIQTIAQALTGVPDGEMPAGFPYPYLPAEDDEECGGQEQSLPEL